MKAERVRQQRAEMVNFIEQQKYEKAMLGRMGDEAGRDRRHADQVAEITAMRNEIEGNEAMLRRELQRKQHDDNLDQATANAERRNRIVRDNMEANERELDFHAGDNFLNEKCPSHFNNRVIRDAYKGSSREERVQVAAQQTQQRMEKEMVKALDAQDDQSEAIAVERTRKQLIAMERDKARRKRELQEQNAQDNLRMKAEQASNTKATNKLFKNEFSPEFFEQFGNGCR